MFAHNTPFFFFQHGAERVTISNFSTLDYDGPSQNGLINCICFLLFVELHIVNAFEIKGLMELETTFEGLRSCTSMFYLKIKRHIPPHSYPKPDTSPIKFAHKKIQAKVKHPEPYVSFSPLLD